MGRKGPRAKTKTVMKSVSKWAQFGSMQNLKFQTFLNKNPPTPPFTKLIHKKSFFYIVMASLSALLFFIDIWSFRLHVWHIEQAQTRIFWGPTGSKDDWRRQRALQGGSRAGEETWNVNCKCYHPHCDATLDRIQIQEMKTTSFSIFISTDKDKRFKNNDDSAFPMILWSVPWWA